MFFLKELPTRRMIDAYTARHEGVESAVVSDALAMMRRASLLIRELDRYFAEHDLSQIRFLVLIVIDREEDRDSLSPLEISRRIDVSKPVTTRTLKGMVEDGLIEMRDDESDGDNLHRHVVRDTEQ